LMETWKLDLDDGSKVRANSHYNMNEQKTKIHITYENKMKEKACWMSAKTQRNHAWLYATRRTKRA